MKITEAKLRQIIREELIIELMAQGIGPGSRERPPYLGNFPSVFDWWENAMDYWGNTDDNASVKAFHNTLSGLEMLPGVAIPAGIMNAFIYHARGDNLRAGISLGFAATGGLAAMGMKSLIKTSGGTQKIFAELSHTGRKLAGKLKGHTFTVFLKNPDAAVAGLRGLLMVAPAAGELSENELMKIINEVDKEVQDGDKAWKKLSDPRTGGMSHPDHPHASVDPATNADKASKKSQRNLPSGPGRAGIISPDDPDY